MSTMLDIITRALRESNLIPIGVAPQPAQQTEGLAMLAGLVSSIYGYDVGENFVDWPVGNDAMPIEYSHRWSEQDWKYPEINSRLLLNHSSPQTVYMPPEPSDGSRIQVVDAMGRLALYPLTLHGSGRPIEGVATVTLSEDNLNTTYIYRGELGQWKTQNSYTLLAELPFPIEFEDYFIIKLAGRLNPAYGRALSDDSVRRLVEMKEQMEARYHQTKTVPAQPILHNAGASYVGGWFNPYRNGWMG